MEKNETEILVWAVHHNDHDEDDFVENFCWYYVSLFSYFRSEGWNNEIFKTRTELEINIKWTKI